MKQERVRELASVPRRVIAYGIDVAMTFVAMLALQGVLYPVNPLLSRSAPAAARVLHGWVTLTVTLPIALFFAASWASRFSATPGQRLVGLQLRRTSGERVSPLRALLRALLLLAPFEINHIVLFHPDPIWDSPAPGFRPGFLLVYATLLLYLGVALWTPRRQGPHDLAVGTVVIRDR